MKNISFTFLPEVTDTNLSDDLRAFICAQLMDQVKVWVLRGEYN
jgi:hypothetical protein